MSRCVDCGKTCYATRCRRCHDLTRRKDRTATCRANGCTDTVGKYGKIGYCNKHYLKWQHHGDPLYVAPTRLRKPKPPKQLRLLLVKMPKPPRYCADCGSPLGPRRVRFCTKKCQRHAERVTERARKRGAFVERVWRATIYKRDDYTCKLCGGALAMNERVPHPLAPTLDHILPLARGGTHEPANVQAAHFLCNSAKGARGGNRAGLKAA